MLFGRGYALQTVLLWMIFFCSLMNLFLFAYWMPQVLHLTGMTPAEAARASSYRDLGAIFAVLYLGLADRPVRPRARPGLALRRRHRVHRRDRAVRDALRDAAGRDLLLRHDDHRQPDRRQRDLRQLYPARMRTSGIGWALGIGRLGGIAAPALGGCLLALGLPPTQIFLSACGFALIAAVATALLVFRGERAAELTATEVGVMKVFVFDLLAYGENLDHLKDGETELPYPLAKRHFNAETAVRTYAEHLDAWEELDRLGYDGVGFNEHHCSPYGLMNSPNLMAAAAAQRTKRLKLLIYGNLLPLHEPLRLAEELAMLDCLSNGRLISGFARGIPREYQVHNVPLAESRARFEEAYEIITRAWTEDVFSYEGKFWSYKDVAIWPRPVQQPHPPIWIPIVGSKESIEFAGRHNIPITPGLGRARGLRDDIIRYYAKCLADGRPPHHARPSVARHHRLCRRFARRRR